MQTPAEAAALRAFVTEAEDRLDEALTSYRAAAQAWGNLDETFETAIVELGAGRCLVRLGNGADAPALLRAAGQRFANLGAAPALEETDTLLAEALALST